MILRPDCSHFPGDRPCIPHKTRGVHCDVCDQYAPITFRIIIVKLDAVGDVLRTTSILQGLKEKYPSSHITWLTLRDSYELFTHNPFVDIVLKLESPETMARLSVEQFDLLINLDASPKSSALASFCTAKEKLGFGMDAKSRVFPFNAEAAQWLEMGAFDDLKRQNKRTYQSIMLEISRLAPASHDIILSLSADERAMGEQFLRSSGLTHDAPIIGLNTGASPRWEQKKWTLEGYRELIGLILRDTRCGIILYGGVHERQRNTELASLDTKRIVNAQTEKSLREFFALLNLSDIVVTGDTLALHAATALHKRVIAIFGPTSAPEIDPYDCVRKVQSELMECKCYYRPVCTETTNCMNTIPAATIYGLVREELKALRHPSVAV